MVRLCHVVPVAMLSASTLLPGCFLFHTGDGAPAPMWDSGVGPGPIDGGLRYDAHRPRRDSGSPVDAGLTCPLVRASSVCLESFYAAPDIPFTLPLTYEGCICCAETECSVAVDSTRSTIELTTTQCPDPCDCDACIVPRVDCAIPPIRGGLWTVEVNGAQAFQIPVGLPAVAPPPTCVAFAEDDMCTDETLPGEPESTLRVCVDRGGRDSPVLEITVTDPCYCARDSACTVTVTPRFTDDLPPGDDILVSPRTYAGACDGPCDECREHQRSCLVPATEPGYHRITVDGSPGLVLVLDDGAPWTGPVCAELFTGG